MGGQQRKIKFENPAAAKMLGYEIKELIGQSAHEIMHHSHTNGSPYHKERCPIYAMLHDGQMRRDPRSFLAQGRQQFSGGLYLHAGL